MASLYLHIPFCTQRCVYCDFYFVTSKKSHGTFVEALRNEIEYYASLYAEREPIETIYFGGGTPSLLEPEVLGGLLAHIQAHFDTSALEETTLEINPEDASVDDLSSLRSLGFDRLSIGVQSFFPSDLEFMHRSHDPEDAEACIEYAVQAGFDDFSVDLIFGIPDQPQEYWYANVQKLIRLGVPHVSTYGLTVEERTPLGNMVARGLVQPTSEDDLADRYRFTMDFLKEHGYEHYEISSFSKPGHRSLHNQTYWNHDNYLGFGPSAHSFWWRGLPAYRWFNERNLPRYETLLQRHNLPIGGREAMSIDMLADEYILLRLRTSDGIDLTRLEQQYGVDLPFEKDDELDRLEADGLIEHIRGERIRLTDDGKLLCDAVTSKLLFERGE